MKKSGDAILDFAEDIEKRWDKLKKGEILRVPGTAGTAYYVALEVGDVRLHLEADLHPKGKVLERVLVLDKSRRILADRVLCCNVSEGDEGVVLPLEKMHLEISSGGNSRDVCLAALRDLLIRAREDPAGLEADLRHTKYGEL